MTINLPLSPILPPKYRFVAKRTWTDNWAVLPKPGLGGFFLEEFWRSCIPEPGQLIFRYDAGLFNGLNYGIQSTTGAESANINLKGSIIRLQMAPDNGDGTQGLWSTVGLFVVEYQLDQMAPGASQLLTSRKFICHDLFTSFAKKWPMQTHGLNVQDTGSPAGTNGTATSVFFLNSQGHPGYNSRNSDGRILGNKSALGYYDAPKTQTDGLPWAQDMQTVNSDGSGGFAGGGTLSATQAAAFSTALKCHTYPGLGTPWTDLDAATNALAIARQPYGPFFTIQGYTDLLNLPSFAWQVEYGMSAYDFVAQILDRSRMRGLAYLDWDDDVGSPTGPINYYIIVKPQQVPDLTTVNPVDGSTITYSGATTYGSTFALDLVGDHRGIAATFELGDRWQTVYDAVETISEPIQVLANLDLNAKSLTKQWLKGEETTYAADFALSPYKCQVWRFDPVYQLFGLNMAWQGTCSNGRVLSTGGTVGVARVDYRLGDDGSIQFPQGVGDTAPDTISVLSDLPLYTGYNYATSTPARYDGTGPEMIPPDRRPWMLLASCYQSTPAGADIFVRAEEVLNMTVRQISKWRVEISVGSDMANGTRVFSFASATSGTPLDPKSLVLVCTLELPHRMRMQSLRGGTVSQAAFRKKIVNVPGLHLWLAPPNAIWDFDRSKTPTGYNLPPLRNAAAGGGANKDDPTQPGLLRDDRARLAFYHALAKAWYLTEHRTLTYQLRDCGFLPGFSSATTDGGTQNSVDYPELGDCITTVAASGQTYTINSPLTKIHYSHTHEHGVTTFITDFCDLDLR